MAANKGLKYRYFFLSFAVSFLVLSLMFLFLMNMVHPKTPASLQRRMELTATPLAESYAPAARDCLTVLFIGAAGDDGAAGSYILARFDPVNGKVPVIAFPPQTLVEGPSGPEPLHDIYRYGGAGYARNALSTTLGITIDRYVRMSMDSFKIVADSIGSVEFTLPNELTLGEKGMQITLKQGKQLLDGRKTAEIIRHDDYKGGELARCAVAAELTAAIVNQRMDIALSTLADKIFEKTVNLIDTDISYPDYENRKLAAQFLARLGKAPAAAVEVSGSFDSSGLRYTLSDTFIARARQTFA